MKYQRIFIVIAASLSIIIVLGVLGQGLSQRGQAEEEALPTAILQYEEDVPPSPTIAPQPTTAPSLATSVLFEDSFGTAASLTNWTFVDPGVALQEYRSVWGVSEGVLRQEATAAAGNPNFQDALAVTGPTSWTDYTISAKVYDLGNVTFGLIARRQGNSFYRYRILEEESGAKQVLEKVVDGEVTPLAETSGGYTHHQWYTVALSVTGATIQVTLDGQVVATATDTTLTSGQAGLYTMALGDIFFDDVVVAAP